MKANEMTQVLIAVKVNVSNFKSTKGDNSLVDLESFTEEQLEMFDLWYDREIAKILF